MERLEAGLKALPTSPGLLQMLCDQQFENRDAKSARVTLQKLASHEVPVDPQGIPRGTTADAGRKFS